MTENGWTTKFLWSRHPKQTIRSCLVAQSCPTLCDPMDCSPPGFSVLGISYAKILEWVVISFSRGISWARDQMYVSCIDRQILYHWATGEAQKGSVALTEFSKGSIIFRITLVCPLPLHHNTIPIISFFNVTLVKMLIFCSLWIFFAFIGQVKKFLRVFP